MAKVTIPYHVKADPGEEDDAIIYTVDPALTLRIEEIKLVFPVATYGELEISLKRGNETVWPKERPAVGDNTSLRFPVDLTYPSGSNVVVHYKNTSDTDVHEAFIYLVGELR